MRLLLLLILAGPIADSFAQQRVEKAPLEAALKQVMVANSAKNATVLIASTKKARSWKKAAGYAHPAKKSKMTTDHQFRLASVTKMFTSVVILQLIEEGKLELTTPLCEVLDKKDLLGKTTVNALLVVDKCQYGNRIEIKHLLTHRSGLEDYWSALGPLLIADFKQRGSNGYFSKQWAPKEIIEFYVSSKLPETAKGLPNEKFHYSDTNFVLLGLVIEKLTGESLQQNYKRRIYSKLGMKDTYLEWYEPFDKRRLSHSFWSNGEIAINQSTSGLNTSADWAGGGLVSTTTDLERFFKGLFGTRLFRDKATLQAMTTIASEESHQTAYGLGIYRVRMKTGHVAWGHFGACGVSAFYFPEEELVFVLTVNHNLPKGGKYVDAINMFEDALIRTGYLGKE